MAHSHSTDHHHHHTKSNIKRAFWINFLFTIIEIIGGIYTNSLAILSDAVHDLGDSLSLGMAWYFEKYANKSRDKKYSYGYRRYSLLSATINSFVICLSSIFILSQAIPRLFNPQESDAKGMILFAILGIIANGAALIKLKGDSSINAKTVYLHLLEDVLGWVAVLIGSIIMLWKDWPIVDPILSILIALYIIYNVIRNLRKASRIFLQGVPSHIDCEEIEKSIIALPFVESIHDFHLWSLDGDYHILTLHICLISNEKMEQLREYRQSISQITKKYQISHVTIEFELDAGDCELEDC